MKLFKFKKNDNNDLPYILDIIVNKRIFLSTSDSMNDPDEGRWKREGEGEDEYQWGDLPGNYFELKKRLHDRVDKQRFTCFVENINNPLMWAHYAGGFRGVAFEFEIDENVHDLRKIKYEGIPVVSQLQIEKVLSDKSSPQDIGILKQKARCWIYEDEWRLYGKSDDKYVNKIQLKSVILGFKDNKAHDVLQKIIRKFGIRLGYLSQRKNQEYFIEYVDAYSKESTY